MSKEVGGTIIVNHSVKLNFVIPSNCSNALTAYCESTGRSPSDILRGLISEYVDGRLEMGGKIPENQNGVRSNMLIPQKILTLFDKKIDESGAGSRGAVISKLLYDFLEPRIGDMFNESVTVSLDKKLYDKLVTKAHKNGSGTSVEDLVVEACKAYVGE